MKFHCRVDGSVCGAVLSNRSSAGLVAAATSGRAHRGKDACSQTTSSLINNPHRGGAGHHKTFKSSPSPSPSPSSPLANRCPRSSLWLLSTFMRDSKEIRASKVPYSRRIARTYNTATAVDHAEARQKSVAAPSTSSSPSSLQDKERYLSYVDNNYEADVEAHLNFYRDPYRRGYAAPDGPRLHVSEKKDDVQYPSHDETIKISDQVQPLIIRLCVAIGQRLRHPSRCSLDSIHKLYCQLPDPKMLHLTGQWRNRLLKVMGTPRKRDMESMLRYYSLVADVKNAGLTLRRSQWNFALAFATKYVARVTTQEMEAALSLWKEMERDAKVVGNEVTFNILFDVAAKAGNFTLADMIYKEMENRKMEFNRFHHVSLIHYFGLKLDSGGIRAAYREMVEAGEIIDTVVLNCVISGLLRCGEESAAEETYQRMKNGHSLAAEMPQRDYMVNKVVTKVLMMFSKIGKQHPELRKAFQDSTSLAPDLHTYKLLVEHHAIKLGNLQKVAQYLDEMKHLKIPIDATIFLALFKGFYVHGGFAGSDWSKQRLDGVLSALYEAHDEHAKGFRIDSWLVIWALRAVQKCSTAEELITTFDLMSQRWDIKPDRQEFMHAIFENILYNRDLKSSQGSWDGRRKRRESLSKP